MAIDWISKLRHLLQTLAFCLAVSAIQLVFLPDRPWQGPVAYSLANGVIAWAVIDFGRLLFPSDTGWPRGWRGVGLVVLGILMGHLLGNAVGDYLCRVNGWYPRNGAVQMQLGTTLLITALAGIVVTYYFYSQNKSAWLLRQMGEAQRHASEARLKLLETQLEPHMLFNTLANLRVLIASDAPRAQQMLDHMIAYLRATLAASRGTTHSLQAEFDRLRDYLELMAVRMGPRLAYTLDLPAELAGQPVPTLLLQPLVENAIQHGLEPVIAGGRITVTARADGATLELEVADSGAGLSKAPDTATGFGLAQVRERLATLYGSQGAIKVIAKEHAGTRALVTFPLKV